MLLNRTIRLRQNVKVVARNKAAKKMRLRLIYRLEDAETVILRIESKDPDSSAWFFVHMRVIPLQLLDNFDLLDEAEVYHLHLYRVEPGHDRVCLELRRSPGDIPDHRVTDLSAKKLRRFTKRAAKLASRNRLVIKHLGPSDIRSTDQNPPS